jgi:hypothetical protein
LKLWRGVLVSVGVGKKEKKKSRSRVSGCGFIGCGSRSWHMCGMILVSLDAHCFGGHFGITYVWFEAFLRLWLSF